MRTAAYLNIILGFFLLLTGCGKKENNQPPLSESNNSQIHHPRSSVPVSNVQQPRSFRIRDIDGRETLLKFQGSTGQFRRIRQPIVILTLFGDWCPPCRGMLPYLSHLQESNRDNLFVIGVLLRSKLDREGVRRFMKRYATSFFISIHPDNEALAGYLTRQLELGENYPLPLTLIFKNGKYVMNIQGAAPYEMLQTLVDQLKKPQEKKE